MKIVTIALLMLLSSTAVATCPPEPLVINNELYTGTIGPIEYIDGEIQNLTCPDIDVQNKAYILCTKFKYRESINPETITWIVDAGATRGQVPHIASLLEDGYLAGTVNQCVREVTPHLTPPD